MIILVSLIRQLKLNCFLTSLLFSQVSFGTNYYGVNHFDAIVAVNLTGMLVMVTLYQTVNDNLPTTSSIKMIDIWMLFALAVPFLEVILQTAMAWIRQTYECENTKEVIDISGYNQTDEIHRNRTRTSTTRSRKIVGPHKNLLKRLIKEAIKEAVTASAAKRNDQDQPDEIEIDTKETNRTVIAWNQKEERTWPKKILRYFFYSFLSVLFHYKFI